MKSNIIVIGKSLGLRHNVCINVIDEATGQIVSHHQGHNAATNSLLTGIGHYLVGEGIINQGEVLRNWIPQYISIGTMGLSSQAEDENGLPAGIGPSFGSEEERFITYLLECPGFGSDGYDTNLMNNRPYAGLGPMFPNRASEGTVNCELITDSYKRSPITFRDVVPEYESEYPKTIDVVFSAMISTGALAEFREEGKDYIFISEVGLWSRSDWVTGGDNGLLAGYRIAPPDEDQWDMSKAENRQILKEQIIRVGINQVVQVIWKVQLGGIEQLGGIDKLYPPDSYIKWKIV